MPAKITGQKKPARRRGVEIKDLDSTKNPKGGTASGQANATLPDRAPGVSLMVNPGPIDPGKPGR